MADFTRPATWEDLKLVARLLNERQVDYALIGGYAIRVNDEFTVDIMPSACGHPWSELKPHVQELVIDDVPVRVLGLEGLALTKEGMREKDRADLVVLRNAIERLKRGR